MKILGKLFKLLCFSIIFGAIAFMWLAIETAPNMAERERLSTSNASQAKSTMQRTARQIKQGGKSQLSFSEAEMNSLTLLTNNLSPKISTQVQLKDMQARFFGYLKPFESEIYVNFSLELLESKHGLLLGDAKLGGLTLDGQWLFESALAMFSNYLKPEHYELIEMVERVEVSENLLQIDIDQGANSIADKGRLASLLSLRNSLGSSVDHTNVQDYYTNLLAFAQQPKRDNSLLYFLKHQFAEANKNSELKGRRAVDENRDAMMALALYFGSNKFTLFTGKLQPLTQPQKIQRNTDKRTITLLSRNDLQKHFVYSMALQLLSDANAGFALGEFKELLDANQGGSGFSFVDLYADRAGTRLAQYATQNDESARAIQHTFANMETESALIPFPKDLPEGIDASRFSTDYVNTQSVSYRQMLALIDEQLSSLHFYAPMQ